MDSYSGNFGFCRWYNSNGHKRRFFVIYKSLLFLKQLSARIQVTNVNLSELAEKIRESGINIRLRISPERVEQYEPANAVLSLVLPKPTKGGTKSAGEIWKLFCHHVFFFSSAEALAEWFKGSDHKPIMLSVEEGYQLGRLAFAGILKYTQKPDDIT